MPLARLVVIEGPDLGVEFEIPLRGGGVGRGEDNIVQLSDPSVSRQHARFEIREGAVCLIDDSGKGKTSVNGAPIALHRMASGDEILVGKTRLAYLPAEGGIAMVRSQSRVTIE